MKKPNQGMGERPDEKVIESSECQSLLNPSANLISYDESSRNGDCSCDNNNLLRKCCTGEEKIAATTSSEAGYSTENKTLHSKCEYEAPLIAKEAVNIGNVINSNSNEELVKNPIQTLKHNNQCSELANSRQDLDVYNTPDHDLKSSGEESGLKMKSVIKTRQCMNLSKDYGTCEKLNESVASNVENPVNVVELYKSENQCTDSVENSNARKVDTSKAIQEQNVISDSVHHKSQAQGPNQVVSNICRTLVRRVSIDIVEDLLVKGFEKVKECLENTTESEQQIDDASVGIEGSKLEVSRAMKDDGKSKENNEYFSLKSSKSSEDYDEVEKSDGSDSGIGSELIDEAITKSSDSSSASSDEFPQSAAISAESWVTPCISFAEMSEIDFSGAPRLSMPTFDDLTRSPCDVYTTEKKQTVTSELEEAETEKSEGLESSTPENVPNSADSDEDIDISSIDEDPLAKQTELASYISASLLSVIPSIPSTSRQTTGKSNLKRSRGGAGSYHPSMPAKRKCKSQGIRFDTVSVYYFPRTQGFTCVPSQGGSTLGMTWHHSHVQTFTLAQYALEVRRVHQRMLATAQRSPLGSPESAGSILANDDSSGADDDSADSDDEEPLLSDGDFDSDSSYTLQPVKIRQRRALLRAAGVDKIDPSEKNECKQIRISREYCGCSCEGFCDPEICACALAGIKCQVDRQSFPCGCTRDCCANPKGRIEFNPVRVHSHYIQTIMRMKAQKKDDDEVSRMYDYQQFHNYHPAPEFEPPTLTSYYPHHHPQYLASHHHHHHHHAHSELLSNFELQHQMHSCYEPFTPELTLYNNLNSHEKMNESFTELLPSSYSGETFSGTSSGAPAPSELYSGLASDSSVGSGFAYSAVPCSYPSEDHSARGIESTYTASFQQEDRSISREQLGVTQPSEVTSVGSEMANCYDSSTSYDTPSHNYPQHYPHGTTGIKSIEQTAVNYEQTACEVDFNPNAPTTVNEKTSYVPSSLGFNTSAAPDGVNTSCAVESECNTLNVGSGQPSDTSSGESATGVVNFGEIISKTMVEEVIV